MPEHLLNFTRLWRALHPDWEYKLWRDGDLDWLHNIEPYRLAHRIVLPHRVGQLRADIARYEIIHRYGGFYADVDTEPLRSITPALDGHTELAVAEFSENPDSDPPPNVGNTYIAAQPGAPVLCDVIAEIHHVWPTWCKPGRQRMNVPAGITGPAVLTRHWHAHNCHIEASARWFPYTYDNVVTGEYPRNFSSDTYAIHHWQHIRDLRQQGLM